MRTVPVFLLAIAALTVAGLAGAAGQTRVVAAFYPLAWAAQTIGGNAVAVENLTPSGAEPHDIELTPRQAGDLLQADVVLYVSHGYQPAVERALGNARGTKVDALARVRI